MTTRYAAKDIPFMRALRHRALKKIADQGRTRFAGPRTWTKAGVLFTLVALPYALILTNVFVPVHGPLLALAHAALFLMVLAIAHDGAHLSFSEGAAGNRWTRRFFDFVGINSKEWIEGHLGDHHANTNIPFKDGALDTFGLLRLHPGEPVRWFHRYQHVYFPMVYACASILQCYVLVAASFTASLIKGDHSGMRRRVATLVGRHVAKIAFFAYTVALPLVVSNAPARHILLGGFVGHLVCGLMLGLFFQITHLTSDTRFPVGDSDGRVHDSFARHTLMVTVDVAPRSKLLVWLSSGLNVHATHHLVPDIAHEHLPDLADIVEATAKEHGLPYRRITVGEAVRSHIHMLRSMGADAPEWKLTRQ